MPVNSRFFGVGIFVLCLLVFLDTPDSTSSTWWARRWALLGCVAGAVFYLEKLCNTKKA